MTNIDSKFYSTPEMFENIKIKSSFVHSQLKFKNEKKNSYAKPTGIFEMFA